MPDFFNLLPIFFVSPPEPLSGISVVGVVLISIFSMLHLQSALARPQPSHFSDIIIGLGIPPIPSSFSRSFLSAFFSAFPIIDPDALALLRPIELIEGLLAID